MDFEKNYSVDNDFQRKIRSNNSAQKIDHNDFFSMTNLGSDSKEILTNINNVNQYCNKTMQNNMLNLNKDPFFTADDEFKQDKKNKGMAKTSNYADKRKPNANSLDDKEFHKKKKVLNKMYNTNIDWIKNEIKELDKSNVSRKKKDHLVKIYENQIPNDLDKNFREKFD